MRSLFSAIMVTLILTAMLTFTLDIKPVDASGTIYIWADGSIDPPAANITTTDNVTYTFTGNNYDSIWVERNNTIIDGQCFTVQGPGTELTGITLNGVTNVTLKNARIEGFSYGINLHYAYHSNISGNNITANSDRGIRVFASSNNSISRNNIAGNGIGIMLWYSSEHNSICKNNITANSQEGIRLFESSNNSIWGNDITGSLIGIYPDTSARYNSIFMNNIEGNDYGVLTFRDNKFFHNNLINNTHQLHPNSLASTWDNGYPSGGNYWDTYTGIDSDYDGIGDTPYELAVNNTDKYPLTCRFSSFNATPEHQVYTICNSTVGDFAFNGTAISFNVAGEAGTTGFCRICIPAALMNDTFRVFVNGTEILPPPAPLPCSNSTHSYLYFNYSLSAKEIVIIYELPSLLILPLFMIATLLAAIVCRRGRQF